MQEKISIFSSFAEVGILDLMFEKSGYNIVFANEYNDFLMVLYQYARTQMTHLVPLYGYHNGSAEYYAKKHGKRGLINLVAKEREKGDLVGFVGGFPYSDFSVAGKNVGVVSENGRLTKVHFDIICRCHPDFFLFESAKGPVKTEKHRVFYNETTVKVQANGCIIDGKVFNAFAYRVPQFRECALMVGTQKGIYQNPPDALSSVWGKYALFETTDILRGDWPRQREFAVDSSYELSFERIPKRFIVEYWFNKNDVEDHPNGEDIFQVGKGRERTTTIAEDDIGGRSSKRLYRWRHSPTAVYGHNEVHLHPCKERRTSVAEATAIQFLPEKSLVLPMLCLSKKFEAIGSDALYLVAVAIAKTLKDALETIREDGS